MQLPVEILPHQARVIQERIRVSDDVNKLEAFVKAEKFVHVPAEEQALLNEQLEHMAMYLLVLDKRVALITGAKHYTCHKKVMARPMNRGVYNALRGWVFWAEEDPADEGYLVEYLDEGQANHPDFAGYISWSPKDVFDKGYEEKS
jgi:hypothetical protein